MTEAIITLSNEFHGTTINLRPHVGVGPYSGQQGALCLSARQVARAKKTLCGIADCTCSDELGTYGPQECEYVVTPDGRAEVW